MTDTDSDITMGGEVCDQFFGDLSYATPELRAMLSAERHWGNPDVARLIELELQRRGVAQ